MEQLENLEKYELLLKEDDFFASDEAGEEHFVIHLFIEISGKKRNLYYTKPKSEMTWGDYSIPGKLCFSRNEVYNSGFFTTGLKRLGFKPISKKKLSSYIIEYDDNNDED